MDRGLQPAQRGGKSTPNPNRDPNVTIQAVSNQPTANGDNGWTAVSNKRNRAPPIQGQAAASRPQVVTRTHMMLRPGMKIGYGTRLPGGLKAEESLHSAGTGSKTAASPRIQWNMVTDDFSPDLIRDCEALVNTEASKLNLAYAVIRGVIHSTTRSRSQNGEVILIEDPNNPLAQIPLREPIDPHLTVYMGSNVANIQLQGHIFVELEDLTGGLKSTEGLNFEEISSRYENGTIRIKGKLPREQRKQIQDGHGCFSEEFFEVAGSLSSVQHNREMMAELRRRWARGSINANYD